MAFAIFLGVCVVFWAFVFWMVREPKELSDNTMTTEQANARLDILPEYAGEIVILPSIANIPYEDEETEEY